MNSRKTLDELLAGLPREVTPPRHVWGDIASGIARQQRNARPIALAAAAACAFLTTGLILAVLHRNPAAVHGPALAMTQPMPYDAPMDAKYTAAHAELEGTFRERLALLDPATRAQIESSLAVIRKAHEDIRKALAAQPSNALLEQLFESTWHDEFDLYDRVVRGTQPSLARI